MGGTEPCSLVCVFLWLLSCYSSIVEIETAWPTELKIFTV